MMYFEIARSSPKMGNSRRAVIANFLHVRVKWQQVGVTRDNKREAEINMWPELDLEEVNNPAFNSS